MEASSLLAWIRAATDICRELPGRPRDSRGRAGGLVEIPGVERVVVVGDLHGSFECLEAILEDSRVLPDLAEDRARLVFLGDLVHDDRPGSLDDMRSSVAMLERACRLILDHPGQVLWLRGNHDSFDPPLTKGWVFQGQLFRQAVEAVGGFVLRDAAQLLFDSLPLVALGREILLAHAGPPRGGLTRELAVDSGPESDIARQIVWNRIGPEPVGPGYYSPEDVRASFAAFGLGSEAAFVVGHNPLWSTGDGSGLWTNVGMRGHHILYSGALGAAPWLCLEGGRLIARFARP